MAIRRGLPGPVKAIALLGVAVFAAGVAAVVVAKSVSFDGESGSRHASPPLGGVAAQIENGGAGACAGAVNASSSGTMAGVSKYNVASHWAANGDQDKRLVSVFVGQAYPNRAVPYAATGVVASPSGRAGCDTVAFQVVPSPLSCSKVRDGLVAKGGKPVDLAGVSLVRGAAEDTMLVASGTDTCVLVGLKTSYAK